MAGGVSLGYAREGETPLFPPSFQSSLADTPTAFMADIAQFRAFGRETARETVAGIPYYANAFWTAKQRQAHALHEVSYRACFKPQLPQFFIDRLTKPGDTVCDPFMGRGTTAIEAARLQRRAFGNDINPLSLLLTRPRLTPISLTDIEAGLGEVDWQAGEITRDDLLAFYHPSTLKQLEALKIWLGGRAPLADVSPEPVADWIRMVAINRLSGHSPGFFSVRSMPPNQAVSVATQQKLNAKHGLTPPPRDVAELIYKKSKALLRDGCLGGGMGFRLQTGDAGGVDLPAGSIDLTITSPPFLDVVDYAADNWLRCWFAGIDVDSIAIARHKNEADWAAMVRRVLADQARLVRVGGHVAFEVGEVRGGTVLLERLVWQAAAGLPFDRLGVIVNTQDFTKTAHCWGVANGHKGTNSNRIVLLRRE